MFIKYETGATTRFYLLPCILLACVLAGCGRQETARTGHYVGSEACRECHEEQFLGWRATRHPFKLQEPTAEAVLGDFADDNTYEAGGVTTTMTTKNGAYLIETAYGADNTMQTFPVKYVIGGLWKQRYITELENGSLMILPVQWNVTTAAWEDYHGLKSRVPESGNYWSDPGRAYQYGCMGCHNTGVAYTYDTKAERFIETSWSEQGIACEACHGPGGVHAASDEPENREEILHPARLADPRKAAMVCGQCHTRGKAKDGRHGYPTRGIREENGRETVMPFQPGDDMLFTFDANPAVHPDGSAMKHRQQYDDWLQSKHAQVGVMCWDCHDPHRHDARFHRSQLREKGSNMCLTCHTNVASTGIHGLHDVNSCVGCHMPMTAKSAVANDIHSHTFKVVMPKVTIEQGEDASTQPNACNLCHYHEDDTPEELQAIVDRIVAEKKGTLDAVEDEASKDEAATDDVAGDGVTEEGDVEDGDAEDKPTEDKDTPQP